MLEILSPSLITTVQDGGRRGWQAYGVPVSGPMDALAHRAANLLAGNPPHAAALEIGLGGAAFAADVDCLVAAAGSGFSLTVDGRPMRMWTSVYVRKGREIRLDRMGHGNWAYIAIHGGLDTLPALGSRATTLRATLGGDPARPLAPGDRLPIGPATRPLLDLAARHLDPGFIPYSASPEIAVIPGPQAAQFSPAALFTFHSSLFTISPASDRTGYRLGGPPIPREGVGELVSEGMARGSIQIPADGLPIVMQADCPTMGGYPKIASVISADQPVLAQAPIGTGAIRFVESTLEAAQARYRQVLHRLDYGIMTLDSDEALWL